MNGDSLSLVRAVRGPLMLIAVGTLFALDHFTRYKIWQTWPTLLILLGLLILLERALGRGAGLPDRQPALHPPEQGGAA
jgi:hypothetical protein